jgi:VWFA-related protein
MVVLSDGVDHGSRISLARAIELAQRAEVLVYSILLPSRQSEQGNGGGLGRGRGMSGGWGGGMGGGRRGGGGYPQREEKPDGKKILEQISKETGGCMLEVSKKLTLDQAHILIEEDLRNQYDLGYTSDHTADSSEFRKIQLRAKEKGSVVQVREGYYASKHLEVSTARCRTKIQESAVAP